MVRNVESVQRLSRVKVRTRELLWLPCFYFLVLRGYFSLDRIAGRAPAVSQFHAWKFAYFAMLPCWRALFF